jgi:hypothetical protein
MSTEFMGWNPYSLSDRSTPNRVGQE